MHRAPVLVVLVSVVVLGACARRTAPVASVPSPSSTTSVEPRIEPRDQALSALAFPKVTPEPQPKPEGHLARQVCSGALVAHPPLPPRTMACCYPAKELIVRPIRALYPALGDCYVARKNQDAEGRVVFVFRVEQSGVVERVCSGEATSVEDEDAVRCMADVMRTVRYPAMSNEEVRMCGLLSFTYPVIFEP